MYIFIPMSSANPKGEQFKFLNDLNLDQDVVNRLTTYERSVVPGNKTVLTTPIADEYGANFILNRWDKIFEANKHRMNSTLLEYEYSERAKFGPRSIMKPWAKRVPDVLDYFKARKATIRNGDKVVNLVNRKYKVKDWKLRPIKLSNGVKLLKNNTNSGLPFYVRKGLVKDKINPESFSELLSRKDPCIMFTRTQEGNKTRTVWGYPIADTLNEMLFYKPLYDKQKELNWRSALLGPEDVDNQVTKLIKEARATGRLIISIDFSGYDASVGELLINMGFQYIKSAYQKIYHKDLEYINNRFKTIGLVTPSGVFQGRHGIPSGSTFTNEVDSIVQYLVALSSLVVDDELIQVQGDDGLYVVKASDLKILFKTFESAGLKVNRSKSYSSDEFCIYLRNLYHIDYEKNGLIGGIYPTYRALTRLLFQERFTDLEDIGLTGQDYFSLRSYSILENCKWHPLFEEFVKFIKSIDKYSLVYSRKGVAKYEELLARTSGYDGTIAFRYGDKIKGIQSFESYKIANS